MQITRIVSGGQTGADRGALDAAIACDLPHGGRCPKGRKAEDGTIPASYELSELSSADYTDRTEANVLEADATVVFTPGRPTGGSLQTVEFCLKHHKPWIHIPLASTPCEQAAERIVEWLHAGESDYGDYKASIRDRLVLNVAGSRESQFCGARKTVAEIIEAVIQRFRMEPAEGVEPTTW